MGKLEYDYIAFPITSNSGAIRIFCKIQRVSHKIFQIGLGKGYFLAKYLP